MKIISKYKDYYDYFSQIYGIDEKLVYKREEKLIEFDFKTRKNFPFIEFYPERKNFLENKVCINFKEIWFCNQRFPFITIVFGNYLTEKKQNFFDYNSFKIEWKDFIKYGNYLERQLIDHFSEKFGDKNTEYKSPQILITKKGVYRDIILKHYNFQRFVSPEQAYQKVYMFLESRKDVSQTIPTDLDRFEAKGFDRKTSFRNM